MADGQNAPCQSASARPAAIKGNVTLSGMRLVAISVIVAALSPMVRTIAAINPVMFRLPLPCH